MSIFSNHSIPTRRLSRIISRLLPVHERLVRLFDVDWWSLVSIKFRKKKKKERFQLNFRLSLSLFIRNKRKKIEKEWSDNEGKRASFGAEEQLLRSVGRVLAGSFVGYDDVNERQRLPLAPHGTHYRRRKRSRYLSTIPPFLHISPSFREYRILPRYSIGKLLTFPKRNDERDRDRSFQRV